MRAQLSIVGRVGRKTFWTVIGVLVLTVVLTAVPAVLLTRLGGICIPIGNGLMSLVLILCGWVSIANQVKRWHDLGRSGWMVFISLVPIVGFLINLICLGFLPGQVGANRFGPPPGAAAAIPSPVPPLRTDAPAALSEPPPIEPSPRAGSARRSRWLWWTALAVVGGLVAGPLLAGLLYVASPGQTLAARRDWLRANLGSGEAAERLALRYRNGEGLAPDFNRAATWLEKAAVKGRPRAQYDTAVMYYYGIGRPLDPDLAQAYLEKAAAQEYGPASTLLGLMAVERHGDQAAALRYWETAVAEGDPHAEALLGSAYLEQPRAETENVILGLYWLESARRDGVEPVAGQLQHVWATVPEDQLEFVTTQVFGRLEAGSPAPLAVAAASTLPAPVTEESVAPAEESTTDAVNLADAVLERVQELDDYLALERLHEEKSQTDSTWADSADGRAVAHYLETMRADAMSVEIVSAEVGGEMLSYAIGGVVTRDAGVQLDRLREDLDYRELIIGALARNIGGAPKSLRIAGLLKESEDRKGEPAR